MNCSRTTSLDNLPRIAATLLRARKLMDLDSDRPSPAKVAAVENAISQAKFILGGIDRRWPPDANRSVLPRIHPAQLRLVNEPFDHPDYIFELKHEG